MVVSRSVKNSTGTLFTLLPPSRRGASKVTALRPCQIRLQDLCGIQSGDQTLYFMLYVAKHHPPFYTQLWWVVLRERRIIKFDFTVWRVSRGD